MTDNRLKRLTYRSWHRGCKETDLILGRFADSRLKSAEPVFVDVYEQLLDEDDADIWAWLTAKAEVPKKYASLIDALIEYNPDHE
jgi:antitoxin CptB